MQARAKFLVAIIWLSIGCSWAIAAVFWRFEHFRPHAVWATASISSIVIPTAWLFCLTIGRLRRGPDGLRAIGWFLVGATPVVWSGAYLTDVAIRANAREPLAFSTPLRCAAIWVSSVMDLEARWRYSRWTEGGHSILLDRGQTENAQHLVEQMDNHMRSMSELLGKPVPDERFMWVRGSLLGQNSRAICTWALCGDEATPSRLTGLDRHEAAHTLITAMSGPDQDPPNVLIEGWAESQSNDRDDLIEALWSRQQDGQAYSLQELVDTDFYITNDGPVYWEGGPVAIFLMERYGPEKFFELYSGVRRSTFHGDCYRILGNSWRDIDDQFWPWLEQEAARIRARSRTNVPDEPEVVLSDSVSPQMWQGLVRAYRAVPKSPWDSLPTNVAFEVRLERQDTDVEQEIRDQISTHSFKAVFEDGDFWIKEDYSRHMDCYVKASGDGWAVLYGDTLNSLSGRTGNAAKSETPCHVAKNLMRLHSGSGVVAVEDILGLSSPEKPDRIQITTLEQLPSEEAKHWRICGSKHYLHTEGDFDIWFELEVAPEFDWRVTWNRFRTEDGGPWKSTSRVTYRRQSGFVLPWEVSTRHDSTPDNHSSIQIRWSELTADQQLELKGEVDMAAALGPASAPLSYPWTRRFLIAAVAGIPILGLVLLGASRRAQCVD